MADEKQHRIYHLTDIYDTLVETYFYEPGFKDDLDEILAAINDRIESIKKGDV